MKSSQELSNSTDTDSIIIHMDSPENFMDVIESDEEELEEFHEVEEFESSPSHGHSHGHGHHHGHSHGHSHQEPSKFWIKDPIVRRRLLIGGITVSSVIGLLSIPFTDSFTIMEQFEFQSVLLNTTQPVYEYCTHTLPVLPVQIFSYAAGFIANLTPIVVSGFFWLKGESHQHSWLQNMIEFLAIGVPYGAFTAAAIVHFLQSFHIDTLTPLYLGLISVPLGINAGWLAYQFHIHFVNETIHAHSEGSGFLNSCLGFAKGVLTTFAINVWQSHRQHQKTFYKVLAVGHDAYVKSFSALLHVLNAVLIADLILEVTGLAGKYKALELTLKTGIPLFILLTEVNSEARSYDSNKNTKGNYALFSYIFGNVSSGLHVLMAVTEFCELVGKFERGPCNGSVYNTLLFVGMSGLFGYPNFRFQSATMVPAFDSACKELGSSLKKRLTCSGREGYDNLDDSAAIKLSILNKFWKKEKSKKPPELDLLVGGMPMPAYSH